MDKERKCLIGHDDDSSGCLGWLIGALITVAIAVLVIMAIVAAMVFVGAIIGAYSAIKNYLVSLKHNVIDNNLMAQSAA